MAVVEKTGEIYHDEHDCTIKITNENTKHIKQVSVTLRADLTGERKLIDMVKIVEEAFEGVL